MYDTNTPITGICLVAKPENVPTGYNCIRKAFDEPSQDADLMADSLFERKDRFVCITRSYSLGNNQTLVMEDMKLINERDTPPPQYIGLTQTVDTRDKGTSKRLICVKMVERQAGMKCLCDIIFLHRTKRPPQFYTLIGEINSLQICVKEGTVPALRPAPAVPQTSSNLYPNVTNGQVQQNYNMMDNSNTNTLSKKSDEREMLDGIPFQINPKYLVANGNGTDDLSGLDSFQIQSRYEIEQYFNYDFDRDRSFSL